MKKIEKITVIVATIGLVLSFFRLPGSSIMITLSFSLLAMLYMYLSFAFFNEIPLKSIFKKQSYKGINKRRLIGAVLVGFALSITVVGLLFAFMAWPGVSTTLLPGLVGLLIAVVVVLIKYQKTRANFYTKIIKRMVILGGLGLLFVVFPVNFWMELKYRNYPEYLEAFYKYRADPYNQELQDKLEVEREKILIKGQ